MHFHYVEEAMLTSLKAIVCGGQYLVLNPRSSNYNILSCFKLLFLSQDLARFLSCPGCVRTYALVSVSQSVEITSVLLHIPLKSRIVLHEIYKQ